jgi:hypothetical protein
VLDDASSDLRLIANQCSTAAVTSVVSDFRDGAEGYVMEGRLWSPQVRWGQRAGYELSETLCQPLSALRSHLQALRAGLVPSLLSSAWRSVANQVDDIVLSSVLSGAPTGANTKAAAASGRMISLSGARQWR